MIKTLKRIADALESIAESLKNIDASQDAIYGYISDIADRTETGIKVEADINTYLDKLSYAVHKG